MHVSLERRRNRRGQIQLGNKTLPIRVSLSFSFSLPYIQESGPS